MGEHEAGRVAARRATWAAVVIGVALSGFFDGILLHQVLQWHHLLSLVPGEPFRDVRVQILADGLFHVAVYAVAVLGLWLLWRARAGLDQAGATRRVLGGGLLGFGAWNIVDVGLFHWVLGIHRIRVNVPNPMVYDLAWFTGLGLALAAIGWLVLARADRPGAGSAGRAAGAGIAAALVLAVPVANLPSATNNAVVVFRPGLGTAGAVDAIIAADAAILLLDPRGEFAVVSLPAGRSVLPFYQRGAVLATRLSGLAGCLAFTRVA